MLVRVSESIVFGYKSHKKPCKVRENRLFCVWDQDSREFDSPHSDQNRGFDRNKSRRGKLCGFGFPPKTTDFHYKLFLIIPCSDVNSLDVFQHGNLIVKHERKKEDKATEYFHFKNFAFILV